MLLVLTISKNSNWRKPLQLIYGICGPSSDLTVVRSDFSEIVILATHTTSLLSLGHSNSSNYVEPEFLFLATVTLSLITDTWIAILSNLDIRYPQTKFVVNRLQQKKVIKRKLSFSF
jgi:hypothetical protein